MMKRILTAAIALAVLLAALATIPAQKVLAGAKSNAVILVHGWNPNSSQSCNEGPEFGDIETYFHNNGISNTKSLSFTMVTTTVIIISRSKVPIVPVGTIVAATMER